MFSNVLIWLSFLVKEVFKTLFLIIFFKIHKIIENYKKQNKLQKKSHKNFSSSNDKKNKKISYFIIIVSNSHYHRSFKEQES